MLAALASPAAGARRRAPPTTPAVALLDAWATVADVVTFYQERIANEGYLGTATERRSVLELARSIGYELRPGVSAATLLDLRTQATAAPATGALAAPALVVVAQGTPVLSVPGPGELPQTFETDAEITLDAACDEIPLVRTQPQRSRRRPTSCTWRASRRGCGRATRSSSSRVRRRQPDAGATVPDHLDFRLLRTVEPPGAGRPRPGHAGDVGRRCSRRHDYADPPRGVRVRGAGGDLRLQRARLADAARRGSRAPARPAGPSRCAAEEPEDSCDWPGFTLDDRRSGRRPRRASPRPRTGVVPRPHRPGGDRQGRRRRDVPRARRVPRSRTPSRPRSRTSRSAPGPRASN